MNNNLVNEFSKLISFIQYKLKECKEENNKKQANINTFNFNQIRNIFNIIKNYPDEITLDNYKELKDIDGIGKGTIDRIKEILETNKLSELKDFNKTLDSKDFKNETKITSELLEIVGVGPSKAKFFILEMQYSRSCRLLLVILTSAEVILTKFVLDSLIPKL